MSVFPSYPPAYSSSIFHLSGLNDEMRGCCFSLQFWRLKGIGPARHEPGEGFLGCTVWWITLHPDSMCGKKGSQASNQARAKLVLLYQLLRIQWEFHYSFCKEIDNQLGRQEQVPGQMGKGKNPLGSVQDHVSSPRWPMRRQNSNS